MGFDGVHCQSSKTMKTKLLILFSIGRLCVAGCAEPFEVQTTFVGNSGGTSHGGPFTVSGVIGQPESGTTDGGAFTVNGGWPAPLIVESGGEAPRLVLSYDPVAGTVIIVWPVSATGFELETTGDVGNSGGWSSPGLNPTVSGTNQQVTLPATGARQFLRLKRASGG
jgi:hypothetical protein